MAITVPVGYDTDGSSLDKQMTSDANKAGDKAGAAGGRSLGKSLLKGVAALGVARGIGSFLTGSLDEAREAQKVGALTANVIKTTGGAAKISAAQVGELSSAISAKVGIDDEAIQSGANLLLTFKNVRNEAGKGANIFDRATAAAVDLSASGFGDLTGTSKQLGKALNDPIKGISALGRSGVTFSEDQKKAIKAMVASNDLLGAQKIILKEVESQVKGAAEAQATSADKAKVAFGNLQEQVGGALLPVIDDLADVATDRLIPAVSELVSGFQDGTGAGGEIRDVLEDVGGVLSDVAGVGKDVLGFFNGLPGPVKESAVQLGVAYLAVTKLQGAMLGLRATGSGVSASLQKTFTREVPAALQTFDRYTANSVAQQGKLQGVTSKTVFSLKGLGGAAAQAGGTAGLLLLSQSAGNSSKELGLLEGAVGGAAAGFAVGGPWGAGIGAIAGGLLGVFTSGKQAATGISAADQASRDAIAGLDSLDSQLSDVTAGYTKAARAAVAQSLLAQPGLTKNLQTLGLSIRDVTSATLGNASAQEKVDGVIKKAGDSYNALHQTNIRFGVGASTATQAQIEQAKAARSLGEALGRTAEKTAAERKQAILAGLAAGELGKTLKGIPDQTVLDIALEGDREARRDIIDLTRTANLTPKQIRLLLKTAGLPATEGDIEKIQAKAEKAARDYVLKFRAQFNGIFGVGGTPSKPKPSNPDPPKSNGRADITVTPGDMTRTSATPVTIIQNNTGPTTARGQTDELQWALTYGTRARGAA